MAKAQKLLRMECSSQLVEVTTSAVEQLVSIRYHGWLHLTLIEIRVFCRLEFAAGCDWLMFLMISFLLGGRRVSFDFC